MDTARAQRVLRQHLATDRLLGVEYVPVGGAAGGGDAAPGADATSGIPAVPPQALAAPAPPAAPGPLPMRAAAGPSLFAAGAGPAAQPRIDSAAKARILAAMDQQEVRACTLCDLCRSRTHTVFGEGDADAALMFVGEGPGETEDQQGRPFVGRAGELLDRMITAMGLARGQVYIANTVKCRPPNNRTPTPPEIDACWRYLRRQILVIQPRVLVALGAPAAKTLLQTSAGITSIRGTWQWLTSLGPDGPAVPVMPTFHPAYLLRSYTPENRRKVWDDLQKVMAFLAGTESPGPAPV